jgi:hypothetical protein
VSRPFHRSRRVLYVLVSLTKSYIFPYIERRRIRGALG